VIATIINCAISKALDLTPRPVLDYLFGKEEEFEYQGSTTPDES
jgi:hypothetical protein